MPMLRSALLAAGLLLTLSMLGACAPDAGTTESPSPSPPPSQTSTPPETTDRPTVSPPEGLLSPRQLRDFRRTFGGDVAVSVQDLAGNDAEALDAPGIPYAWSTIKAVIVAQTLVDSGGPGGLTAQQRELIRRALGASDNEAAAQLHEQIMQQHGGLQGAADAMTGLLRKAGDETTDISTRGRDTFSTYGQTDWPVTAQTLFLGGLIRGCVIPEDSAAYLVDEMGHVAPDQRWGLGMADSPAFKGGWGPDPDGRYLVRQFGVLTTPAGGSYTVAIMARPRDGSFESGKQVLTAASQWIEKRVTSAPDASGCGK